MALPKAQDGNTVQVTKDLYQLCLKNYMELENDLVIALESRWAVLWGQCAHTGHHIADSNRRAYNGQPTTNYSTGLPFAQNTDDGELVPGSDGVLRASIRCHGCGKKAITRTNARWHSLMLETTNGKIQLVIRMCSLKRVQSLVVYILVLY